MFGSNGPRLTQVCGPAPWAPPFCVWARPGCPHAKGWKPALIASRSNQTWWFMFVSFVRCLLIPARSNDARVGRRRPFWSRRWRKRVCGFPLFGLNAAFFAHAILALRNFTRILRKVENFWYFSAQLAPSKIRRELAYFGPKPRGFRPKYASSLRILDGANSAEK